jgi:two-component system, OmpR family, response regulator QseB
LVATHLLIAEDELLLARSLERFFRRSQLTALAMTLADAYALLQSSTIWCGAVVDILLPDGSGLDLVRELRRRGDDFPILVLTRHLDADLVETFAELRADYAMKPTDLGVLAGFASRVGAARETARETPSFTVGRRADGIVDRDRARGPRD